jgi:hypothetical protein
MNRIALRLLKQSLAVVVAAGLLAACTDVAQVDPNQPFSVQAPLADNTDRAADLGSCESLQVPVPNELVVHAFARGVQIYRWNGTTWTFVAPSASLFADADGHAAIGVHYVGPTWESVSGSKVVGTVRQRCTADPNAIPWLLLQTVSADGPGIFDRVAFIQRLNTAGGNAPAEAGSVTGEAASVPYTAEYFFYRAK